MAARYIWLNEAASSYPKAPGVGEAMLEAVGTFPACSERSGGGDDPVRQALGPVIVDTRARLADLLAVEAPERIILAPGVTYALNMAIWGIGFSLPRGAQIISSLCEHNAVLRPLRHLRKRRPDVRLACIGLRQGELDAEAFRRILPQNTGLVVLIHASNVTGHIYDVGPLFAAARSRGAITVLDASQSVGHLDVHPEALQADIVAFPAHKGLRGPVGVGAMYVRPGLDIEPVLVGGTGKMSGAYLQPAEMPLRLEAGTPNLPAIAGLRAALDWQAREGAGFREHEARLAHRLRAGLRRIEGVTLYDDYPDGKYTPVVSFKVDRLGIEEAGGMLSERYGIICRAGLHCAPLMHVALGSLPEGTVRLSCSGCTTDEEIDAALTAVAEMADGCPREHGR